MMAQCGLTTLLTMLFLLPLVCAVHADSPPSRPDFYVAPNGNDHWSGTKPTPNRARTDGPFATLEGARNAVRSLHRGADHKPLARHATTVEIRGGRYELARPFALTEEDSGTAERPIVYRAREGEEVRLVGGKVLKGFTP